MREMANFLRRNPQALVLLVICLILGLGTFIAVLIGLAGSGAGTPSGEPSGLIAVPWIIA
jgi:hypothetical protein